MNEGDAWATVIALALPYVVAGVVIIGVIAGAIAVGFWIAGK